MGAYAAWVRRNAALVQSVDEAATSLSLLLPDRFGEHEVLSESVHVLIHLLQRYHNRILGKPTGPTYTVGSPALNSILQHVETVQVLLEMFARRSVSKRHRWTVVLFIELVKAAARTQLLRANKGRMLVLKETEGAASTEFEDVVKMYKKSGRGKGGSRHGDFASRQQKAEDQPGTAAQTAGEAVYIARPVAHVLAIMISSQQSWKPFFTSLFFDVLSRRLSGRGPLGDAQRAEMQRRLAYMLYYLVRPPLFSSFLKSPLVYLCSVFERIPLLGLVFSNLIQLIRSLEDHHFYTSP